MPVAFGRIIDKILPSRDGNALNTMMMVLVGLLIVRSIFIYFERELGALVGSLVVRDVRTRLHQHLLKMSLRYLDEYQVGRIVSRLMGDTECVRQLLLGGFVNGTASGVRLIFIMATLLWIDWRLTLASCAALPLFFVGFWYWADYLKPAYREINDDHASLSASVNETFSGMRVVKTYCGQRRTALDFMSRVHGLLRKNLFVSRTQHILTIVWEGTAFTSVIAMLWYGGHRVVTGQSTAGELVAFYALLGQLHGPIADLISLNATLQPATASIEQIGAIFDSAPEIADLPNAVPARALRGQVEFRNVKFSYQKNRPVSNVTDSTMNLDKSASRRFRTHTLENISFKAMEGECIAIVGASGSGKSTLVNLLARLYDVDSGAIEVDGVDIRRYKLSTYVSHLAIVLQENFLFRGTLRDNIRYSRWNASEEEIVEAAKMAGAWEFISALPEGLDALCGERGVTLSGGQKQRLSIARAILANPRILILDEATSALDSRTERLVQAAMERLMKGRTTFIVAHRLSTIVNADKIIVMEQGGILELGSHAELLLQNGRYADMFNEQFGDAASPGKHAKPAAPSPPISTAEPAAQNTSFVNSVDESRRPANESASVVHLVSNRNTAAGAPDTDPEVEAAQPARAVAE